MSISIIIDSVTGREGAIALDPNLLGDSNLRNKTEQGLI